MDKFIKINKLILLLIFLSSCGVGEALQGKKRSDQGDEFLINKKNPLTMPPDFNKLPRPGEANIKSTEDIKNNQLGIKDLLKNSKNQEETPSTSESTSIESSIIKKIK